MKKLLSMILILALCLGLAVPAAAAGKTVVNTAEELQAAFDKGGEVVLGSDIGSKETLTVTKSTRLDLDGYKLTILSDGFTSPGLVIELGQTLTVSDSKYTEAEPGSGKLYVSAGYAGIKTSGATLVIDSGVVESICTFRGAGIGGTDQVGYRDGGTVTINGGVVTAAGDDDCAGIGGASGVLGVYSGGGNGGTVTINGGTVTATGGNNGAGIGGGSYGESGTITINGGTVQARGTNYDDYYASSIGVGYGILPTSGSVKVNGGTVELLSAGIDGKTLTLKSCTITGDGAGDNKGSYDMSGNKIIVQGASGWAEEGVAAAIARSLVPLSLQSSYVQPATRAEFCALGVAFYETVTGKEITERKTFSDTDDVNVQKMGALGVVSGVGNDRFDPSGTLTREQAATMLVRLAEAAGTPLPQSVTSFADKDQIADWARSAVGQAQAAGIMGGTGNNQFSPAATYTREQSIITISRLFDVVK